MMEHQRSQEKAHDETPKSSKRPPQMKFMFIEPASHGTNVKPDRAVRSFVMQKARRSKPWTTKKPATTSQPSIRPQSVTGLEDTSSVSQELHSTSKWHLVPDDLPVQSTIGSSITRIERQSCPHSASSSSGVCNVPYCYNESCGRAQKALARRDGFALGVLDPFDCLAVPTDAKSSSLIDHFVTHINPLLIPLDIHKKAVSATGDWVRASLQTATSAPFAYALLTTSAFHLQAKSSRRDHDVLYYKARAISEVNMHLSDPKTRTDDSNITAVSILLTLEEVQSALDSNSPDDAQWIELQRKTHLDGLRKMIEQRGGLAGLSSNRCLQTFLLVHALAHAVSTFQRPYIALLDSLGRIPKYGIPSFRDHPELARILRTFRELKLTPALLDIICDLIVFTSDLSDWFDDAELPVEPLELTKQGHLLIHRLLDWYLGPDEKNDAEEEESKNPVDRSICLTLLIFAHLITQPHSPSYRALMGTTVRKLRKALTRASIFAWSKSPDLLLWTLTIGAHAAQGSTEAPFFENYASVAFADAGLEAGMDVEELLDRMKKILWIDSLLDKEVKQLWAQMGLTKGGVVEIVERDRRFESPDIKDEDVVGMLSKNRFFS